jgi:Protein of unknown function (DUF3644)
MAKRKRKMFSFKNELLTKSREAMLCAVQVFNNPSIVFKSENFIVLSTISWTYLLHAYYRSIKIDYRYFEQRKKRKRYDRTKRGSYKYWELERCLNDKDCPIDSASKSNLKFLIGLRHEIEHQMTTRIDDYLSAKFQACCLNYNHYVRKFFGEKFGIDKKLSFSLQFSSITEEQVKQTRDLSELPVNISSYISDFDDSINEEEFNNPRYAYRVIFVPKTVNHKGQADKVIEFFKADSPEAQGLNKEYAIVKELEKPKYLPSGIVKLMKEKGYAKFGMSNHTDLWRDLDAKNPENGFGVLVAKTWYWYDSWRKRVEQYCQENYEYFR